jgi:hypothetical protein
MDLTRFIPAALAILWGLNWPAVKIALSEVPPFALRMTGLGAGALLLLAFAAMRGPLARRQPALLGSAGYRRHLQHRRLQPRHGLRAAQHIDVAGGDPDLHHPALGDPAGLSLPRRASGPRQVDGARHRHDRHRHPRPAAAMPSAVPAPCVELQQVASCSRRSLWSCLRIETILRSTLVSKPLPLASA